MKSEGVTALLKESEKSGIKIDESVFGEKKTEQKESTEPKNSSDVILEPKTIDERMKKLNITKEQIVDIILDLADNGCISEKGSVLKGKVDYVFETKTLSYSREYLQFFEETEVKTQALMEYHMNLFSMASILKSYKGEELPVGISDRVKWIESGIPGPIYGILMKKASDFHDVLSIIVDSEVESFL